MYPGRLSITILIICILLAGCVGEENSNLTEMEKRASLTPSTPLSPTPRLTSTPLPVKTPHEETKFDLDRVTITYDGLIDEVEAQNIIADDGGDAKDFDLKTILAYTDGSRLYIGLDFNDLGFVTQQKYYTVINLKSSRAYQLLVSPDGYVFKDYGMGARMYLTGDVKWSCNSFELVLDLQELKERGIGTDFVINKVGVVTGDGEEYSQHDTVIVETKPYRVRRMVIQKQAGIFENLTPARRSSQWEELKSGDAVIRYHKGDGSYRAVVNALEVAKKRVCDVLPCPEKRLKITIFADHEEYENHYGKELPVWSVGSGNKDGIYLESPSNWNPEINGHRPYQTCQILVHEFAHYVTHNTVSHPVPKWFNEGISVYLALQNREDDVREAIANREIIPLSELDIRWYDNPSLAYAESGSFVKFLVDSYGKEIIKNILLELNSGKSLDYALKKLTGKSLEKLEDQWIRNLQQ